MEYVVYGKILEWDQLVNALHSPILLSNYFILQSVLATHAAHLPILYPPISSD